MERTESSQQDTTTININRDEIFTTEVYAQTNMIRVRQTNGFQICTYFITIYFVSVALFFLAACLLRTRHVQCKLQCNDVSLSCECQLESRVSWSTPTYVQLSWAQSQKIRKQLEEIFLDQATIQENQSLKKFQSRLYTEVNCFPSECLVLIGTINQIIADNSRFILKCTNILIQVNQMQISNNKSPILLFRELNSTFPQLSTYFQLGINLFFAIMVGLFIFIRQKMQIEMTPPSYIKNTKLIEPQFHQKSEIDFPEDIIVLNNELQRNRSKAARHVLNKIDKNILNYSLQEYFSREFTNTL